MEIVKVINNKIKNGKVVQYTVMDVNGNEIDVAPHILALTMKKGQIVCANLKLNNNGELEPYNSQEAIDKFNTLASIRATNNANSKHTNQAKQQTKADSKQVNMNLVPSICGVSIKNIKKAKGWEGYWYSGTVYLNEAKLGTWSQDDRGGSDYFDFNTKELEKIANDYFTRHNSKYSSLEVFIGEVLYLCLDYKNFKKYLKSGYDYLITVTDINGFISSTINASNIYDLNNRLKPNIVDALNKCYKSLNITKEKAIVKIYHCDNDFITN